VRGGRRQSAAAGLSARPACLPGFLGRGRAGTLIRWPAIRAAPAACVARCASRSFAAHPSASLWSSPPCSRPLRVAQ
jgi:hypothetical protein